MEVIKKVCTNNRCYKAGRKITVGGLMLHSVGCPQPRASVFVNAWNRASAGVCPHGIIDGDNGAAYQTLPWNHRGWHCGSGPRGSGNDTHIGIEMCEPANIEYTGGANFKCKNTAAAKKSVKKTYKSAVKLFSMLCKRYGLAPLADGAVISHREGCARGIATNHGDPEHLWRGLGLGYTMDTFRAAVFAKMHGVNLTFETGKAYTVTKPCYLRSSAGVKSANIAPYRDVSLILKSKCKNKNGNAVFLKGKTIRLTDVRIVNGDVWGRMKNGWWIELVYNGEIRIK